ncbi:hypothetical protein [Aquisalimonas asiatica]|uniref:Uncharacterized protein n=1 Tax=Aquisalimonas asiatica TaxID=406100 RepID=A0A1H8TMU8_9GAMM|nr:hypothetical protein [Aquisalimonas asiatica]SEO92369.1 hypothetical protein SAMN04488052_104334 [Aquisalimonas asiatica]
MSGERDLRAEAQALCRYLDSRGLHAGDGVAVMAMAVGASVSALADDEVKTRKVLAALHERMLQAAGIHDQPPERSN